MRKKLLCLLLAAAMAVSMVTGVSVPVNAESVEDAMDAGNGAKEEAAQGLDEVRGGQLSGRAARLPEVRAVEPTEPEIVTKPGIQNDTFWKATDGSVIYSQGGGIFRFGDTYYWYGVKYEEAEKYVQDPSKYYTKSNVFAGVTCYSSKDLVKWQNRGIVVTPEQVSGHEEMNGQAAAWVGRLGVAYMEDTRTYALFVQHECADPGNVLDSPDAENDQVSKQVLVLTSDTPDGTFTWNQRINMYDYTGGTSNTGDQTVFTDEGTGKDYLVYSYGRGRGKMFLSEIVSQPDGKVGLGKAYMIYQGAGREGNCMFRYKDKYYVCASDLYGWNASHAYYLTLDSLEEEYLENREPTASMKLIEGCSDDFCHVSQTGFFYTVKGSVQDTVIFCGDRWAAFAGNGLGFNQWCPLSFNESGEPHFNSLSAWDINAATGKWSVHKLNNYVKNGSFDADRVASSDLAGWQNTITKGTAPINNTNDRATGKYALKLGDNVDFDCKVSQTIASTPYVALPEGFYDLKAKVKNSGGFESLSMYAKANGLMKKIEIGSLQEEYTEVTLKDIFVKDGTVEVGFLAQGSAGASCLVDDVSLSLSKNQNMITGDLVCPITSDTAKDVTITAEAEDGISYVYETAMEVGAKEYRLGFLKSGSYRLDVSANACELTGASQQVTVVSGQAVQAAPVTVKNNAGDVEGMVTDGAGEPLSGVTVTLTKGADVFHTVTGEDGKYRLKDLAAGTYELTLEKEGYLAPGKSVVEVVIGKTTAVPGQVMECAMGTVAGKVLDASGKPLEGVSVVIRGCNTKSDIKRYVVETDSTGSYHAEVIAGKYYITATPYDYDAKIADGTQVCAVAQDITVEQGGTVTKELKIPTAIAVPNGEFEQAFSASDWTVTGTGASQNGKRPQDCHSGTGHLNVWSNSPISFTLSQTLTGVENGAYTVQVSADGAPSDADELYLWAKDSAGEMIARQDIPNGYALGNASLWEIVGLNVDVRDQTLTVGISGNMAAGAWTHFDEFRVGKVAEEGTVEPPVPVDKQALKALLEEANGYQPEGYTETSYAKLVEARQEAQKAYEKEDASQEEVTAAVEDLQKAIDGLEKVTVEPPVPVDKQALKALLDEVGRLKEADYTKDSFAKLITAKTAAQQVMENADSTQQAVDAALSALKAARDGLKKVQTPVPPKMVKVKSIKLAKTSYKLAAGKKVTLALAISPKNASNKAVSYKISGNGKKYVSVSKKGVVTTKKGGAGKKAVITVTAKDGSKKKAKVTIQMMAHAVKKITLKAPSTKVKAGKKVKLQAKIKTTGKKVNKTLEWSVSNKKYATVSKKGVVTTKKAGAGKTVTITAKSTDGTNKKAKIKIRIKK